MRIVCYGFNRILVRAMETKSPYFSPKKTRNFTKKAGLSLLQKVTQPNKPTDSNSTEKKDVRLAKVKAQSSTHVTKAKTKTGKKRVYNIRVDGASVANDTIKEEPGEINVTPQTLSEATSSLKTPEKRRTQNVKKDTAVLDNREAGVSSVDVKIKLEPPEEAEIICQPICEKTPAKQEPVDYLSPVKREIPDNNDDSTGIVKEAKWEPNNWRQMMDNIREMRRLNPAPVDTMGCDQFTQDSGTILPDRLKRYHCLVSLMLSSQTKDQANHECMLRLKKHGLTPESIVATDSAELQKLIYPVGFYKNKTRFIKEMSQILIDQYGGDIPNTIEGLLKLPGVGKKMAHLCMRSAWNIVTGIGVDTHVHRIANWLQWVPKETKNPEETRQALEKWLPYELWDEVNHMMVGFGQTICTSRFPRCNDCLNASICPALGKQPIRNTPIKKEVKMEDLEF
ncbi:endonuclease III-like protein 1 [Anopheles maculipalpis]|uniref:endonuclease III-like protein 1 n=1 Tax=Anopheles maculipalpis TaxID=1496333 RepID=UPI002158AB29|nr:endonuclease III-like protein 1 [Anopheles maculipalpis]